MSASDRQELEYQQVAQLFCALDETRFRLLAFVPTIAGAAVGLISGRPPAVDLLAVGLLGLFATMGILVIAQQPDRGRPVCACGPSGAHFAV